MAYLDSAATSQRPKQVIEAMDRFQSESYAPIHRGVYELARESTDAFEAARERIASFVNWDPACSIFTRNATEAINLVAYTWGREQRRRGRRGAHHGDGAPLEHRAVADPCEETGAKLRYLTLTDRTSCRSTSSTTVLAEGRVKLVAVAHVSNVLGTINPVAEIARARRAAGAVTLMDGSQAVPQMPVDLARDRRRLLRLDRPQGARTDHRSAARAARAAYRGCAPSSAAAT